MFIGEDVNKLFPMFRVILFLMVLLGSIFLYFIPVSYTHLTLPTILRV